MTDHRPECIYTPEYFDPEQNIVWDGKPCICSEIKRAEKRAYAAATDAVVTATQEFLDALKLAP